MAWMWAAAVGNTEVVKLLLAKGANMEAKNNAGTMALINAAANGNPDLVKLLLNKGGNIEAGTTSAERRL
jgi:ankyrin repeat protein